MKDKPKITIRLNTHGPRCESCGSLAVWIKTNGCIHCTPRPVTVKKTEQQKENQRRYNQQYYQGVIKVKRHAAKAPNPNRVPQEQRIIGENGELPIPVRTRPFDLHEAKLPECIEMTRRIMRGVQY